MTEKELKKQGRGAFDYKVYRDHSIMVWEWYNRLVVMGSNVHGVHPLVKMKLFNRKKQKHVEVECPAIITRYNETMGGVDKRNMLLSMYRTHLKTKKWYSLTDLAAVNARLLYRCLVAECAMQFSDFELSLRLG